MTFEIVEGERRHLPGLEALERACFSVPWTLQELQSQLPDEQHVFLIAEAADGELLGYAGMMYVLDEGYISNIAVSPKARRQGIAGALIEELLRRAGGMRLRFVTLEVRESNTAAISLYTKYRFLPVGRRKEYYTKPKEDALLMTVFLKEGEEIEDPGI